MANNPSKSSSRSTRTIPTQGPKPVTAAAVGRAANLRGDCSLSMNVIQNGSTRVIYRGPGTVYAFTILMKSSSSSAAVSIFRNVAEARATTLLALVGAVGEITDDDREVVATILHMLRSGEVRLCGNFRNHPVEDFE